MKKIEEIISSTEIRGTIKKEVKRIFLEVFDLKPEEFSFEKKLAEYANWDSLAHMQMISKIEDKLNLTFDIEQVISIESAYDVLKLVEQMKEK